MRTFLKVTVLLFLTSGLVYGQWPEITLKRIREIRLLASDRVDVKRVFAEYNASDDDDYSQYFSNDGVNIEVLYSSGKCSRSEEKTDKSRTWKIAEWKVTQLEISFDQAMKLEDAGIEVSKFTKEQRYEDDPDSFILFSKERGMAVDVSEDGVERVIIFPPKDLSTKLCGNSTVEKDFYSAKGRFISSSLDRQSIYDENFPANVTDLQLNHMEISATTGKLVSVLAIAVDPENDVLTYSYAISAGRIRGVGAKVIWDLTGVPVGVYTITAGVDDGCGICGKTIAKTITVK